MRINWNSRVPQPTLPIELLDEFIEWLSQWGYYQTPAIMENEVARFELNSRFMTHQTILYKPFDDCPSKYVTFGDLTPQVRQFLKERKND